MKSTIQRVLFAVTVATLGAGAVGTAAAQAVNSSAPNATPQHHGHRGHFRGFGGGALVGTLLRATRQLGQTDPKLALSQGQQDSIKLILSNARKAHQPGTQPQGPGITVLGNPGSQGYSTAVLAAEAAAKTRIQNESVLAGEIYDVLLTPQKTALANVLTAMQAKEQARRAQWAAKHASSNG